MQFQLEPFCMYTMCVSSIKTLSQFSQSESETDILSCITTWSQFYKVKVKLIYHQSSCITTLSQIYKVKVKLIYPRVSQHEASFTKWKWNWYSNHICLWIRVTIKLSLKSDSSLNMKPEINERRVNNKYPFKASNNKLTSFSLSSSKQLMAVR